MGLRERWKRHMRIASAAAMAVLLCACSTALADGAGTGLRGYTADGGWQYLELGAYAQTLEGGLEPIVWRVLSVNADQAYLVSEYVLANRRIHPDDQEYALNGGDFTQTEMYIYLNGAFLDCFTAREQSALLPDATGARVTLLSAEDLRNPALGFTSNASRAAYGTPYAVENGLFQYGIAHGCTSPYWTRTQSPKTRYGAYCTKAAGNLGYIRVVVQNEGCRPACTLNLKTVKMESGDGTLARPFQLSK